MVGYIRPRAISGYPAWAGIDLGDVRAVARLRRLPRVGGDRPPAETAPGIRGAVTPRGRG